MVAIRLEPKLDKHGRTQRYASGAKAGQIKTRKVRYFRAPNEADPPYYDNVQYSELPDFYYGWQKRTLAPSANSRSTTRCR